MTEVRVDGASVRFEVLGLSNGEAVIDDLTVPLASIVSVKVEPGALHRWSGLRTPGATVADALKSGVYISRGKSTFWDVHKSGRTICVELQGVRFSEIVVDVEDPERSVAELLAAIRQSK
jgi:hypothetical protein